MSIEDASGAGAAKFYADFQHLAALKKDAKAQTPDSIKAVARQFEGLFTQMMLKSMRSATPGDSLFSSDQENFYRDMFDQQMSVQLSQGKGLGLADMLVQQLMRNGAAAAQSSTGASETTAANTTWPPQSREDFVKQILPAAQEAGARLGVDPQTLVAHAALETDWGKSVPAGADGTTSFNLFGVKAGAAWTGQKVASNTTEYVAGQALSTRDSFRAYASPADSIRDYASLLSGNPRYSAALGTGSDTAAFATALQQGGYATDPNYAAKLTAVARSLKSSQLVPITGERAV